MGSRTFSTVVYEKEIYPETLFNIQYASTKCSNRTVFFCECFCEVVSSLLDILVQYTLCARVFMLGQNEKWKSYDALFDFFQVLHTAVLNGFEKIYLFICKNRCTIENMLLNAGKSHMLLLLLFQLKILVIFIHGMMQYTNINSSLVKNNSNRIVCEFILILNHYDLVFIENYEINKDFVF